MWDIYRILNSPATCHHSIQPMQMVNHLGYIEVYLLEAVHSSHPRDSPSSCLHQGHVHSSSHQYCQVSISSQLARSNIIKSLEVNMTVIEQMTTSCCTFLVFACRKVEFLLANPQQNFVQALDKAGLLNEERKQRLFVSVSDAVNFANEVIVRINQNVQLALKV